MLSRLVTFIGPGIALYFLLFHGLTDVAFLSADEPRYASIGRAMAQTGDWITPSLNAEPWFEKPPLLYWMTATAWKLGLRDELAARLPVALLSAAFLIFFYLRLRRDFGHPAALASATILATTTGWIAFSNVAVTDLPLTAMFSIAMLLALPGSPARPLPLLAGVFLGFALLAKGLVPAVLALPALYFHRHQWRRILAISAIAAAIALPWFLLATARHGALPFNELILKHHLARFFGGEIHHERPFWFYLPVLLGGLLPWTPAMVTLRPGADDAISWRDPRLQYLAAWAVFGFLFFTASTNKLPGYLLPILPPIAALIGIRWTGNTFAWVCAPIAFALPLVAGPLIPSALVSGITKSSFHWPDTISIVVVAGFTAYFVLQRLIHPFHRGPIDLQYVALGFAVLVALVKYSTYPLINQLTSGRQFYAELSQLRSQVCIEFIDRDWQYSLDYYAVPRIPSCETTPKPYQLIQTPGSNRPEVRATPPLHAPE